MNPQRLNRPGGSDPDLTDIIHRAVGTITTEGLSFGIVVVDEAFRVLRWNGWMERHSGIPEKAIIGADLLEEYPEIRKRGKDGYLRACVEQQRTALLSPLLHGSFLPLAIVKDQQAIPMLQSVKIYPFLDGEISQGAIIIIQDMTESILHEREIQQLTRILDGIRNVNKLMVRVDAEDALLAGACDILASDISYPFAWVALRPPSGSEPTAVAAAPPSAVKRASFPRCRRDCPVIREGTSRIIDDTRGEPFSRSCLDLETVLGIRATCCLPLRAEQRVIGVLHICSADANGFQAEELQLLEELATDIDYAVETIRERDRRKRVEAALKENEARLRQSRKMEAIGVLAGGIAHDFNNILYPLIGFSEMLSDDIPRGTPNRDYVEEVLTAAYRARDLVQQILAFSRQSEQAEETVFLAPIIKESLQLIRASLPATIEIHPAIDRDCGPVLADPTQIYQVVMNLCTNAFQAMEETGGVLTVGLEEVPHPNPLAGDDPPPESAYIRLSVQDTGVGMDESVRDRIFEPYFTTKARGKGTGMGLAVVHGLVAGMGGHIKVASTHGKGTRFEVYLPRAREEEPERGVIAEEALDPGHGEQVLVVDDEAQNVRMMGRKLEDIGYAVTGVTDSLEALSRFREAPSDYDLLITDLTMPGLSGDALAREVLRCRPDLPVILCTGYREKITPDGARAIGIRHLLEKPIGTRLLARAVQSCLKDTRIRRDRAHRG